MIYRRYTDFLPRIRWFRKEKRKEKKRGNYRKTLPFVNIYSSARSSAWKIFYQLICYFDFFGYLRNKCRIPSTFMHLVSFSRKKLDSRGVTKLRFFGCPFLQRSNSEELCEWSTVVSIKQSFNEIRLWEERCPVLFVSIAVSGVIPLNSVGPSHSDSSFSLSQLLQHHLSILFLLLISQFLCPLTPSRLGVNFS